MTRQWRRDRSTAIMRALTKQAAIDISSCSTMRANGFIATAHHMDDQVETVLQKLLRGVHISQLSMMRSHIADDKNTAYTDRSLDTPTAASSSSSSDCSIAFVKPMLALRKRDLVQYLERRGLTWREDVSNAQSIYDRNRVRLQLVPVLEDVCGGADALWR